MPRWYVFPRQMWQSSCSSCSAVIPFMVPCVPTGMNTGVLTLPWGSASTHARALLTGHSATIRRTRGTAEETALPAAMSDLLSHVSLCAAGAAILKTAKRSISEFPPNPRLPCADWLKSDFLKIDWLVFLSASSILNGLCTVGVNNQPIREQEKRSRERY